MKLRLLPRLFWGRQVISLYRSSIFLVIVSLSAALLMIAAKLAFVSPGMGNGGAFLVALSIAVVLIALTMATLAAWFAAAISFIWKESMPQAAIYHFAFPFFLSLPGTGLLMVAAWSIIR